MAQKLDKENFILTVTHLISEYGQEKFCFIGLNNKVVSVLEYYNMIIMQDMIECIKVVLLQ